uniref:Methyltransferase FkbM domain-containing protein n=1 Tax=Romanomermis culicivorax TaxID=13658 RepID=A0A915KI92_ROMCU
MRTFRSGHFKVNGLTLRTNGSGKLILAIVVSLSFIPIIYIINNVLFGVGYSDMVTLDDDYIAEWAADDPRLIKHIRDHYLEPPSPREVSYNLEYPNKRDYSHKMQSKIVENILGSKRDGFFVECGAYDGETYSNSLSFEKYLDWTGVLIEPDHANLKRLRAKNRKSWIVRGCLEGNDKPKKMLLYGAMDIGTLGQYMTPVRNIFTRIWRPTKTTNVWCFPLYSILLAVNHTKVDYFSLDVEGAEMSILKALPFDKIDIDVLQVEFMVFQGVYWDKDLSNQRKEELRHFMKKNLPQYKENKIVFLDIIYVKDRENEISAAENSLNFI